MAHAHKHFGADKVVVAEMPHASSDDERRAVDRRAARAPRHLHGGLPMTQKGMDINLPLESRTAEQSQATDQIVLNFTADRRIAVNNQDVAPARARTAPPQHLRVPQGKDDVHHRRN